LTALVERAKPLRLRLVIGALTLLALWPHDFVEAGDVDSQILALFDDIKTAIGAGPLLFLAATVVGSVLHRLLFEPLLYPLSSWMLAAPDWAFLNREFHNRVVAVEGAYGSRQTEQQELAPGVSRAVRYTTEIDVVAERSKFDDLRDAQVEVSFRHALVWFGSIAMVSLAVHEPKSWVIACLVLPYLIWDVWRIEKPYKALGTDMQSRAAELRTQNAEARAEWRMRKATHGLQSFLKDLGVEQRPTALTFPGPSPAESRSDRRVQELESKLVERDSEVVQLKIELAEAKDNASLRFRRRNRSGPPRYSAADGDQLETFPLTEGRVRSLISKESRRKARR